MIPVSQLPEVVVILYGISVVALIAECLGWLFFYAEPFVTPTWLVCIRLAVTAAALWKGRLWKDRGFVILISFYLLLLLRILLGNAEQLFDISVSETFLNGLWAFVGCYAVGRMLKKDQVLPFLKLFIAVWTVLMTVHASIALYAAWNNHVIWTIGKGGFWGIGGTIGNGDFHYLMQNAAATTGELRLYSPLYATTGGSLLSISVLLSLLGLLLNRPAWAKCLYALAFIPLFLAMALTDSRAAHITTSAGIAVLVFAAVFLHFRKPAASLQAQSAPAKKQPAAGVVWTVAVLGMLAAFVIMIFVAFRTITVFNNVKVRLHSESIVLSTAAAEEEPSAEGTSPAGKEENPQDLIVSSRGLSGSNVLNGRQDIWKTVLLFLKRNPLSLLTGESVYYPMNGPNAQPESLFPAGHCHCMPLQLLLVSGIPGLLLILAFVVHLAVCSIRLITSRAAPGWMRWLPAPIVTILVGELVECFTNIAYPWPITPVLMVLAGIVSTLSARFRPDSENAPSGSEASASGPENPVRVQQPGS